MLASSFGGLNAAFLEDRVMIELQQKNFLPGRRMVFIPQDKAPAMFRKMIADRIAAERTSLQGKEA